MMITPHYVPPPPPAHCTYGCQTPPEVLTCLCSSLVGMLRSCLPDSFGAAGRVYDAESPTQIPRAGGDIESVSSSSSSDDEDGDEGWGEGSRSSVGRRKRPPAMTLDSAASNNTFVDSGTQQQQQQHQGPPVENCEEIPQQHEQPSSALNAKPALSVDKDSDTKIDAARTVGRLAAALRLQRLLYGVARANLRALGEGQTRVVLDGLSAGLQYARAFQGRWELRTTLFQTG